MKNLKIHVPDNFNFGYDIVDAWAAEQPDKPALLWTNDKGEHHQFSFADMKQYTDRTASYFQSLGIGHGDMVMLILKRRYEFWFSIIALHKLGAVVIPATHLLTKKDIVYRCNAADIKMIVAAGEEVVTKHIIDAMPDSPTVKHLVSVGPEIPEGFDDFHQGIEHAAPFVKPEHPNTNDDISLMYFTSGTTGESKGVIITYDMYREALRANSLFIPLDENDIVLDFLPLSHIFERAWSFFSLAKGAIMALNIHPHSVGRSMYKIRPTAMCVVPHFWEKIYENVREEIENSPEERRNILEEALRTGHERNVVYGGDKNKIPENIEEKYQKYEKSVFAALKSRLGLERARLFPTAGATTPVELEDFVRSCGFGIVIGYGLTETTATVSCDDPAKTRTLGSVGRIIDGLEITFDEHGEILLRGKTITPGYFHRTDSTQDAFNDGWFRTGDAGYMKEGELFLTGRIKDLYKTSNGKYVAPQMLEAKLGMDLYINQVVIVAEQKKFVSALIVPDYIRLEDYAYKHKIRFASRNELCSNMQIREMMAERIEMLQQELADYEKVKQFVLLSRPFDAARGELTATLKVCRKVVCEHYADEIEKLYNTENNNKR